MMQASSIRTFLSMALVLSSVSLATSKASASPAFPGAIQEAADMQCVPVCTLCHTVNPGTSTTWVSKYLPQQLVAHGVKIGDADSLKKAWAAFLADPMVDANMRAATVAQVKAGKDQNGLDICGPSYGCGAHLAKAAPRRDLVAPLWIVGAMLVGGILRRRKNAA